MIKTLKISFSLKMTYCMNSILYALKQIPLIKRLLPGSLYGAEGLKVVITILALIWEVISAFLGKFVYLLLMVFLVSGLYGAVPQRDSFLHILFFLTLIGAVMNTYMFNPTKDKYYAILLMRMNAREYTLVNYSYEILKVLVGFLVFGCILGAMVGVPIWVCVLIPFFVAGCKLFVAAWCLRDYDKTGKANNENVLGKFVWIAIALLLAAAYGLPAVGIVIPWQVIAAVMVLALVLGLISIRKIYRFENYRDVYRQIIGDWNIRLDTSKSVVRESNRKLISMDASISSNRKGFEYLNDLFVKRHQKILWRATKRQAVVCLVLFGAAVAASLIFPEFAAGTRELLLRNLPLSAFFMYLINRGTGFTQALFINCDHSLLTYSFYKRPGAILKLFRIRLREIMKINLLPALVIGWRYGPAAVYLRGNRRLAELCSHSGGHPGSECVFLGALSDALLSAAALQCGHGDEERHLPAGYVGHLFLLLSPDSVGDVHADVRCGVYCPVRSIYCGGLCPGIPGGAQDLPHQKLADIRNGCEGAADFGCRPPQRWLDSPGTPWRDRNPRRFSVPAGR